jgi:hypothetical protein
VKSDNIFRFVSLRPPLRADPADNPEETPAREEILKALEEIRKHGKGTDEDKRKEVGKRVVEGDGYYDKDAEWAKLRPLDPKLADFLKQAKTQDRTAFRAAADSLLKQALGAAFDLDQFVGSASYASLQKVLWHSYYGNVLAISARPADRAQLARWIVFLWLFEAGTDEEFRKRAKRIGRARPSVPGEFFFWPAVAPEQVSGAGPAAPQAPRPELPTRLEDLRGKLKRLSGVREFLQGVLASKAARFRNLQIIDEGAAQPARAAARAGRGEEVTARQSSSSVDLIAQAPWRLAAKDLESAREHEYVLKDLGIYTDDMQIPSAITRIESSMADLESDIAQLERKLDVIGVGYTFSKVTRPVGL